MNECKVFAFTNVLLVIISIIFFYLNRKLEKALDDLDPVKLYDIRKNESMTSITQIRKRDGKSCNISRIYENEEDEIKKNGDACI